MSPPGKIGLRPNEFSQPDYSVIYKDPDGRELSVGRIFRPTLADNTPVWFWSVEFHPRKGRAEPHDGRCDSLDEATAAWRRCWDFSRRADTLAPDATMGQPMSGSFRDSELLGWTSRTDSYDELFTPLCILGDCRVSRAHLS